MDLQMQNAMVARSSVDNFPAELEKSAKGSFVEYARKLGRYHEKLETLNYYRYNDDISYWVSTSKPALQVVVPTPRYPHAGFSAYYTKPKRRRRKRKAAAYEDFYSDDDSDVVYDYSDDDVDSAVNSLSDPMY